VEVGFLNQTLKGGFIAKIFQPLPREIVMKVRLASFGEKRLVLSADPALGRIHTTRLKIPNPPSPPRFCAYLRAHLQGSRIESIVAPIDDRIVVIRCIRGSGEETEKRLLILEILGRDSNIILVRVTDGTIMECLHRMYPQSDHLRKVVPGMQYEYPPKNPRGKDTEKAPGAASQELVYLQKATTREAQDKMEQNQQFLDDIANVDELLDARYSKMLERQFFESFRRDISGPLNRRLKSLSRRLQKIEEDQKRLNRFALQHKCGELIKFNLKKIKKGMTYVMLHDWETDAETRVDLDPALSPSANMQNYFAKSSKAKRGASIIEERLKATKNELGVLQDMEYFVSKAQNIDELEELSDEISLLVVAKDKKLPKSVKKELTPKVKPFKEYKSPSGKRILVGRSARGNELIRREIASKNDLWFHAKDIPGAHVFLLISVQTEASDEDIRFAAGLAIEHSKAKNSGKGEVIVASVKDVVRSTGFSLGQVQVKSFYTLMAKSYVERLEK
ncbi:MAG: NFACT family protein, partial [Syntrophaceae bacterium]|nr:NFACT family protein [Syntrophaceae bacterium]